MIALLCFAMVSKSQQKKGEESGKIGKGKNEKTYMNHDSQMPIGPKKGQKSDDPVEVINVAVDVDVDGPSYTPKAVTKTEKV